MRTTKLPENLEHCRLLSAAQMADGLGFSLVHFRKLYRTGKIPAPVVIGSRKLGWPPSVLVDLTSGRDARHKVA